MLKNYSIESKLIERNYIIGSIFLFFWFLSFIYDVVNLSHGGALFWYMFLIFDFGFIVSGIALTIEARKRKPIFWLLMISTLMAISYIAIPVFSGFL